MIGSIRSKIRELLILAIDSYGRRTQYERFHRRPQPDPWGLDVNSKGHLSIGDIDLIDVVEANDSPLHIVNGAKLAENYGYFLSCFQQHYPKVNIGYSYKTNPVPLVLRKLHELGACAEVISHFELWLALRLGVGPENIIFNGPGKTLESIQLAVKNSVRVINIDSLDEIHNIASIASDSGKVQSVGLRLVASVGWSGQFGLSIAAGAAWEAVERISKEPSLKLTGLHIHLGTGIKDVAVYLQAVSEVLEFSQRIRAEKDISIQYLDFGGGFGIPTVSPHSSLDRHLIIAGLPPWPADYSAASTLEADAKKIVNKVMEYYDPKDALAPTLIFEPGRAITGSAQVLLLKVLTVKDIGESRTAVILNGGRNIIMPPQWEHHEVLPASKMLEEGKSHYDLYGPLCHPGDLLFQGRWMPELVAEDYLAIMDTGAYFIPNQMNFSNPRAAVAYVDDDGVMLAREQESFEDMISLDSAAFDL